MIPQRIPVMTKIVSQLIFNLCPVGCYRAYHFKSRLTANL
jgi:hypothetical protein